MTRTLGSACQHLDSPVHQLQTQIDKTGDLINQPALELLKKDLSALQLPETVTTKYVPTSSVSHDHPRSDLGGAAGEKSSRDPEVFGNK